MKTGLAAMTVIAASLVVGAVYLRTSHDRRPSLTVDVRCHEPGASLWIADSTSDLPEENNVNDEKNWRGISEGPQSLRAGLYYYKMLLKDQRIKTGIVAFTRSERVLLK